MRIKNSKRVLIIISLLQFAACKCPDSVNKLVIPGTNAVFKNVSEQYPELGDQAMQDPNNLVWGSVVDKGEMALVAEAYCKQRNARMPTLDEYGGLLKFLGSSISPLGIEPKNYNPPAGSFFAFETLSKKAQELRYLWTRTEGPESGENMTIVFYVLDAKTGTIGLAGHRDALAFRCVKDGKK